KFNDESNVKTLQQRLESALNKKRKPLARQQSTDSDHHFRLINYHGPHKGMRVGEMFDYTSGAKQPTARMDKDADTLSLKSVAPADKQTEFLHSILYFGIKENSVILSQSMSLRSLQFEDHINWLLRSCGELSDSDFVALNDQPPLAKAKEIKNAKGVEFKAPVDLTPSPAGKGKPKGDADDQIKGAKSVTVVPSGNAWDYLKLILPPEFQMPKQFQADDIIQKRSLEIKLVLTWDKVYQKDSTDFMDAFSNQLRHVDTELDYTILTKSGKITRDELKLKKVVSVTENAEGLIRREAMWERIYEWLKALVNEKIIKLDINT